MGKEVHKAIRLLEQWEKFIDQHPEGTKDNFAHWLLGQKSTGYSSRGQEAPPVPFATVDQYVGYLLGRLFRFSVLWSKKMFDESPLRTMEEYGILKIVQYHPHIRKSDIAYHAMIEPTTCFEIVKRLQKMGYLVDNPDETDRRSRRVNVTEKGKQVCEQIDEQMAVLSTLLLGRLTISQKQDLTQLLRQLDGFHEKIYAENRAASLEEITATYLPET